MKFLIFATLVVCLAVAYADEDTDLMQVVQEIRDAAFAKKQMPLETKVEYPEAKAINLEELELAARQRVAKKISREELDQAAREKGLNPRAENYGDDETELHAKEVALLNLLQTYMARNEAKKQMPLETKVEYPAKKQMPLETKVEYPGVKEISLEELDQAAREKGLNLRAENHEDDETKLHAKEIALLDLLQTYMARNDGLNLGAAETYPAPDAKEISLEELDQAAREKGAKEISLEELDQAAREKGLNLRGENYGGEETDLDAKDVALLDMLKAYMARNEER